MKYQITGKNIDVTSALDNAVGEKIVKLNKYFNDSVNAQVTLSVEKRKHIVEITIPFNGTVLRAEVDGDNMYNLIDDAVAIIEKRIHKCKGKIKSRKRGEGIGHIASAFANIPNTDEDDDDTPIKIAKTKRFAIKPMNAEEAVMQMELLGHNFFVYLDGETEELNVVYKRKDGTYGLIEPIFEDEE